MIGARSVGAAERALPLAVEWANEARSERHADLSPTS